MYRVNLCVPTFNWGVVQKDSVKEIQYDAMVELSYKHRNISLEMLSIPGDFLGFKTYDASLR